MPRRQGRLSRISSKSYNGMPELSDPHMDELFEDLFIAVLSVNQYSLEKTWTKRDALRSAGLLNPKTLSQLTIDDIARLLRASGLDRGDFMTKLFAERLSHVARFILTLGVPHAKRILASKRGDEIAAVFKRAKGIGPKVISNFWALRNG
jgi:hypothetical protein